MTRARRRVRIGLGVLIAAYAALNGLLFFPNVTMFRLGLRPPFFPEEPSVFLKVIIAVPWWQFALWPLAIGLFALAAYRLMVGRKASQLYTFALASDVAFLTMIKVAEGRSGPPGAIDPDYWLSSSCFSSDGPYARWIAAKGGSRITEIDERFRLVL